jgi:hypothetical protein
VSERYDFDNLRPGCALALVLFLQLVGLAMIPSKWPPEHWDELWFRLLIPSIGMASALFASLKKNAQDLRLFAMIVFTVSAACLWNEGQGWRYGMPWLAVGIIYALALGFALLARFYVPVLIVLTFLTILVEPLLILPKTVFPVTMVKDGIILTLNKPGELTLALTNGGELTSSVDAYRCGLQAHVGPLYGSDRWGYLFPFGQKSKSVKNGTVFSYRVRTAGAQSYDLDVSLQRYPSAPVAEFVIPIQPMASKAGRTENLKPVGLLGLKLTSIRWTHNYEGNKQVDVLLFKILYPGFKPTDAVGPSVYRTDEAGLNPIRDPKVGSISGPETEVSIRDINPKAKKLTLRVFTEDQMNASKVDFHFARLGKRSSF